MTDIKQDEVFKDVPVLVLTSSDAEEDVLAASSLGANGYIRKAGNVAELAQVANAIDAVRRGGTYWKVKTDSAPPEEIGPRSTWTVGAAASENDRPGDGDGIRVLLIEDNPGDSYLIQELLEVGQDGEFRVQLVASLGEARRQLASVEFDVVLTDLSLPDAAGLESVDAIAELRPDLPIVVLSGMDDEDQATAAIQSQAQEYLVKGTFDTALLTRTIRHSVERAKLRVQLATVVRELENQKRALDISSIVIILDRDKRIRYVNDQFCQVSGYAAGELIGKHVAALALAPISKSGDREFPASITKGELWHGEIRGVDRDGKSYWIELTAVPFFDQDGEVVESVSIGHETSDRRRAEMESVASARRFQALVQNAADLVAIIDSDGILSYVSPAVSRALGRSEDELLGRPLHNFVHLDSVRSLQNGIERSALTGVQSASVELELMRANGSTIYVDAILTNLLGDPAVEGIVVNARDITERKRYEQRLARQAFYDPLTRLPNRALLADRLENAAARGARETDSFAVMFLDLDGFKNVNDKFGHAAGDDLLSAVAHRLRRTMREGDTVARFAGDEFVVLAEKFQERSDVIRVAERILESMREPFVVAGSSVEMTTSIGIAFHSVSEKAPGDILGRADIALYQAKAGGRAQYVVFEPGMKLGGSARI